MRLLVRHRLTRSALLVLADHGVLRHSVEEAIKRELLARHEAASDVVPLPTHGRLGDDEAPELDVRSSVG